MLSKLLNTYFEQTQNKDRQFLGLDKVHIKYMVVKFGKTKDI